MGYSIIPTFFDRTTRETGLQLKALVQTFNEIGFTGWVMLELDRTQTTPIQSAREMKAYVEANRTLTTPFDIVVSGKIAGLEGTKLQDKLVPWVEAGATWWVEGLWEGPEEQVIERIRQGPPRLE